MSRLAHRALYRRPTGTYYTIDSYGQVWQWCEVQNPVDLMDGWGMPGGWTKTVWKARRVRRFPMDARYAGYPPIDLLLAVKRHGGHFQYDLHNGQKHVRI